ncbi:MAG: hypothetical protein GY696_34885 [Gammaproteobacteria bacterium]|nr:hypothetical protein [Gammaproteobacteria bacterium]
MIDDIVITPDQARILANQYRGSKRRRKRASYQAIGNLWPSQTIYYTTDTSTLSTDNQALITEAIDFYNSHTCLDYTYFVIADTPPATPYLLFRNTGSG